MVGGTLRPSAFAVLRLITSSNLVGCINWQIGRFGLVQTTFSCAHDPSLFSQGNRFCMLCAEAQAPMVVIDKTKLCAAVCAAVLKLSHENLSPI